MKVMLVVSPINSLIEYMKLQYFKYLIKIKGFDDFKLETIYS